MMELSYLTFIAIILVAGLLVSAISRKAGIPSVFFLILLGIIFGNVHYNGMPLVYFPSDFVVNISTLAIVMIVFEGSSMLKLKDFNIFSLKSLKLFSMVLIINVIFFGLIYTIFFNQQNFFLGILLGVILAATAAEIVLCMLQNTNHKNHNLVKILEIESIINTPFVMLFVVMIITTFHEVNADFSLLSQIFAFLQQIVVGIGSGILIGLVVFKLMKRTYLSAFHKNLAQLGLIGAALLAYVISENMNGSGIIAITAFGVFFGNSFVKEKTELEGFSTLFSDFLEILVFVMLGLVIKIQLDLVFMANVLFIFLISLFTRYLASSLVLRELNTKAKIFVTLVSPKGIATATIALLLASTVLPGLEYFLNLLLFVMLLSIIISSITTKFAGYFLSPQTHEAIQAQHKSYQHFKRASFLEKSFFKRWVKEGVQHKKAD